MAKVIKFHTKDSRQPGIAIFNLPMPDGSFRTYFQKGGAAAVKSILERWKRECAARKAQAIPAQCRVLPFRETVNA